MSEMLSSRSQLLSAPERPHKSVIHNLARVAREFGYPDFSDGVNNIGNIEIATPEEEQVCAASYTSRLLPLARQNKPLHPDLESKLFTKATVGTLSMSEFAIVGFNFPDSPDLRLAMMPGIKKNPGLLVASIQRAMTQGFIEDLSTDVRLLQKDGRHLARANITWQGQTYSKTAKNGSQHVALRNAYFKTYAQMIGVDPESVADSTNYPMLPHNALGTYIDLYGGQRKFDESDMGQVRQAIKTRYEEDLHDKIFYPDPLKVLGELYGRQNWSDIRSRHDYFHTRGVKLFYTENVFDEYRFKTRGPTLRSARQAAAKLILDHVGATNHKLLD